MGRRINAIRRWHNHTYMTTIPVLSPRSAGLALMVSPRMAVSHGIRQLFSPDSKATDSVGPDTRKVEEAYLAGGVNVPHEDYEEVVLAVNDDMDIVLRNFNTGVRVGELSPLDQLKLIAEGIQDTHFRDLNIPLYRPV